jgi:hypothetical protein
VKEPAELVLLDGLEALAQILRCGPGIPEQQAVRLGPCVLERAWVLGPKRAQLAHRGEQVRS